MGWMGWDDGAFWLRRLLISFITTPSQAPAKHVVSRQMTLVPDQPLLTHAQQTHPQRPSSDPRTVLQKVL
jgi:hypothetical protein